MGDVIIREFAIGDEGAFRRLNEEWITRHFVIEPKDEHTLAEGARVALAQDDLAIGRCTTNRGTPEAGRARRDLGDEEPCAGEAAQSENEEHHFCITP